MLAFPDLTMAKAIDTVVIDHPCRLHEGIANGRANERKAPLF